VCFIANLINKNAMFQSNVLIRCGNVNLPQDPVITFPYELDACQKHALCAIEGGDDMLLSWPTGVGKTTPAIYAILHTVKKLKRRVVYTTPIKSLSNEKFNEFTKLFAKYDVTVGILTGDNKINPEANCIIMTAEILQNSLFQTAKKISNSNYQLDENLVNSISTVIMDEVHYINDKDRGTVWEMTITNLPQNIQLIMLSGTVGNPNQFCKWVSYCRKKRVSLIMESKRIVPLTHSVFVNKKSFQYLDNNNVYTSSNFVLAKNEYMQLKKEREKAHKLYDEPSDITDMVNYLHNNEYFPAIFFSFSRKDCEKYASMLGDTLRIELLSQEEKDKSNALFQRYIGTQKIKYENLSEVHEMYTLLQKGIAYHHSNVLQNLRELVEILMKDKLIKILFATETLCIGVNVPAKTCIFTGIQKYTKSGKRIITSSEYRQMSGRAGRRGMDSFGLVYLLPLRDIPYDEDMKTITAPISLNIKSNFRLDYQLILKFSQIDNFDILDFFDRSLMNYENIEQISNFMLQMEKLQNELNEIQEKEKNPISDKELSCVMKLIHFDDREKDNFKFTKSDTKERHALRLILQQEPNLKIYYDLMKRKKFIENEISDIENKISNVKNYIKTMYTNYKKVLIDWEYILPSSNELIDKKNITMKGIVCSQINECNVILLTEMICEGYFLNLNSKEIVALLSVFIEPTQKDVISFDFTGTEELHNCIHELKNLVQECEKTEKMYVSEIDRTDYTISTEYIDIAYEWASGKTVHEMLHHFQKSEMGAEAFRKGIIKISNILSSMINIYSAINKDIEIIPKLEEANKLILRDIVCVTSLYLTNINV
jgi:superfamily II RNA helicase